VFWLCICPAYDGICYTEIPSGAVFLIEKFVFNLGRIDVCRLPGGVVKIAYLGLIGVPEIRSLGAQAAQATKGAGALLFDFTQSVLTISSLDPLLGTPVESHRQVHGAVVLQDMHAPMFDAYADRVAGLGIMRAVFLSDEYSQALQWATRQSWVASHSRLRQSQLDMPSS